MVRVELDIFSGRPNPVWELQDDEVAELESILARSSPLQAKVDPPGLGYRGFIVHRPDPIRIYKGQILNERNSSQNRLADIGIKLDLWLLEKGRPYLDPGVYDACLDSLSRR
jgi:hypothetical protein